MTNSRISLQTWSLAFLTILIMLCATFIVLKAVELILFAIILIVAIFVIFLIQTVTGGRFRDSFESASNFITILGIFIAACWFLAEGYFEPKLTLSVEAKSWANNNNYFTSHVYVKIYNSGSMPLNYHAEQLQVDIGVVVPRRSETTSLLSIEQFEFSNPIAKDYQPVDFYIEAGESEQFWYRLEIPCESGRVFDATIRLPSKPTRITSALGRNRLGGDSTDFTHYAKATFEAPSECD